MDRKLLTVRTNLVIKIHVNAIQSKKTPAYRFRND